MRAWGCGLRSTQAYNIAGITNKKGNVLGMMPHPERASEAALGSADGLVVFRSMVASLARLEKGLRLHLEVLAHDVHAEREPLVRELRVAPDDGEEVVEVVRDPPGEPPHCLHLLGLSQAFLALAQRLLGPS